MRYDSIFKPSKSFSSSTNSSQVNYLGYIA
uniref:Uncharacterized protein n=1 Tax=Anguilla anguilla TaxID=7936 RepID=A0A0E9T763_ANGAN